MRKRNQNARSRRRLQTEPCVFTVKKILLEDGSEIEQVDCYDTSTDQFVHISGSKGHEIENQLLDEFHNGMITSGQSTLMQEGAYFDDEEGSLILPDLTNVQYGEDLETRRKLAVATGTKEMLAVSHCTGCIDHIF